MPRRIVGTGADFLETLEQRTLLDSSLSPPVIFQGQQPVIAVAAGDFDGDGLQDLAVASYGPIGKRLAFLKGNGDGTFESPRFSRYPHQISQLAAADFDGDGRDELVLSGLSANGQRSRLARIEFNDDARKLRVAASRPVPGIVPDIAVARGPDGPAYVLCSFVPSVPSGVSPPYQVLSVAFTDPVLPIVDTAVEAGIAEWRGFRVADVNDDGLDDIVFTLQSPLNSSVEEFTVFTTLQSDDPLLAGTFGDPTPILTMPGYAHDRALLADVDLDGDADIVIALPDGIYLFRGDGMGDFLAAETLFQAEVVSQFINIFQVFGVQTGPTGELELQVLYAHEALSGGPGADQFLLRFLPQGDGSFDTRRAFQRSHGYVPEQYLMLQLTDDPYADVVWLSSRHADQVLLFNSTGEPRPPDVGDVVAHPFDRPRRQTITTGQYLALRARINDPEKLLGEPGGIRRVRFYLDTNNNGIIDPGDVLAGTKRGQVIVGAHWPRGTFNILAEAIDITGLASEVVRAERTLTIV